ncbi:hypothetical protein OG738_21690 [Amycolatopsis sp. NBC_01488]|uniref:hypothetical protein n=1 Tax=Amycolatopsis sp. NBC_01488 TaxID=2903563 RepID=UPI002E28E237|nr:hypothetical protein [Amycolatopsis sp. NBC_01488]
MDGITAVKGSSRKIAEHAAEHNQLAYAQVYATLSVAAAIDRLAAALAGRDGVEAEHVSHPETAWMHP